LCCKELVESMKDDANSNTGPVSSFFSEMVGKLFEAVQREDAQEKNLFTHAFEAISALVRNAPLDMVPVIFQVLDEAVRRLNATYSKDHTPSQSTQELQEHLCEIIGNCVQRLEKIQLLPVGDNVMQSLIQILSSESTAQGSAFTACGHVAEELEHDFVKYMPHFMPYLYKGLDNHDVTDICTMATVVISDLCRALADHMGVYSDEIMARLLRLLQNPSAKKELKHHAISTFGDIALAVGMKFIGYLPHVNEMLYQAGLTELPSRTEDEIEYLNNFREAILEAYAGIINGIGAEGLEQSMYPKPLENIVHFLNRCYQDPNRSDDVLKGVVGLLGDIACNFGVARSTPYIRNEHVDKVLQVAASTGDPKLTELSTWARGQIWANA